MGDGDGSDGVGGDTGSSGDGVGDGSGGGFDFGAPPTWENSGYSPALYDLFNPDAEDKFKNKKYQGFGFGGGLNGNWNFEGSTYNPNSGVDSTAAQVYTPLDKGLASSLGYKGSLNDVMNNGAEGGLSRNPEWNKFLADNNYRLGVRAGDFGGADNNNLRTQTFDKNGNAVGKGFDWKTDDDKEFGWVASALAAGAGGIAAGGLAAGAGYGAGTAVGAAATGAGAGFAGTAMNTADIGQSLKGALIGGASGGLTNAVMGANPSSYLGLDGATGKAANTVLTGAARGGLGAALSGGNVLGGAISGAGSGASSAAGSLGNSMFGDYMAANNNPDYGNEGYGKGTSMGDEFDNLPQGGYSQGVAQPSLLSTAGLPDMNAQAPNTSYPTNPVNPSYFSGPESLISSNEGMARQKPAQPAAEGDNPVKSMFMQGMSGLQNSGIKFDNMGSNLMDLYNRYKQNSRQGALAGNLSSLYGQDSPYAQMLRQTLLRHDAASGRRSQVGPREVELQARLAELNSKNAPTLNNIYGQQSQNQVGMANDLFRLFSSRPGGAGMGAPITSAIGNYFNPAPQPSSNPWENSGPGE